MKILDNFEFEDNIDTYIGNSGSPICIANSNKLLVVGIHKEGNIIESINYGTFIGYILDILENEEKGKNEKLENLSKSMNNVDIKEQIVNINKKEEKLEKEVNKEGEKEEEKIYNKNINLEKCEKKENINKEDKEELMKEKEDEKNPESNITKTNLDIKITLKIIKSTKILKKIFFYIDEKIKLKIIKYNKSLQTKNEINIKNYKSFSDRYIKFITKFKGREYSLNNNHLLFKGEYLNGKRNGKGKEYNEFSGKLIFEGEYLNGKRNGKGKEYNEFSGKLIFEGEYLN